MRKTDISIVIVNYNVKDFLLQCLRSVEKSLSSAFCTDLSVETIVVDNDSNDFSVEYLRPMFPNVKFIDLKENIGFGRANNIGFDHSNGRYVLILNPDTIIEENTLKVMFDYMEANPEVGVAGCKVLNPDGSFQLACRRGFPSPWSAFSKLFGLQKLFPKSKIFAGYNQTFRSEDETYYIDALIGAFMFARKETLDKVGGFDPDFFMYGEDLDLCYRINKENQKIAYVHTTSILHYKGESTKRSSMNEVKHFYEAMEIFAGKHFSGSKLFLLFLRLGIMLRAVMAYAANHKRGIFTILFDLLAVNASMLIATKIRSGMFFGFPDYAYPTLFIVLSSIIIAAMIAVGEYFESKPTVTKSIFALMISFFVLSSLTYFFREFASSRVIILMTIGFSSILTSAYRVILNISESISEHTNRKLTAIVGENENTRKIAESLEAAGSEVIGIISNGH
ncbi:MAG: glycosyltransferase, partial [Chlorobi bacterium]|nr:glycosyltransferase [Chlorobiota bacterium]